MNSVSDLVDHVRTASTRFVPPVQSLLDIDFYKFTMGQAIYDEYNDVEVVFKLIVRDQNIPVGRIVPEHELRQSLDHARSLMLRPTDLYYLRGMNLYQNNMFNESYLGFLREFRLPPYVLKYDGDNIELTFRGRWCEVTMWETIALAIVSELYYRALMKGMSALELQILYGRAISKIAEKFEKLLHHPRIRFADFGQRRRHSFLWQEWVIGAATELMGKQFVGASNTWMAFHHDLSPIGTNAHEMPMVVVALAPDNEKITAQYEVLRAWQGTYGQGLQICLPDTYGTEQFFRNAPHWVSDWKGFRQDSGDPVTQIRRYIDWLKGRYIDPKTKLAIPSDGLDVDTMIEIDNAVGDEVGLSFGWGSLLTNDFRDCHPNPLFRPFSMVCKVVEANGRPCVKLSDNIGKATGPAEEIARYVDIFGSKGRIDQEVVV